MSRLFNAREGFTPADDVLPRRFLDPLPDGPQAGLHAIDPDAFDRALQLYYDTAGWDPQTGAPAAGRMAELGLAEFLDDTAG